MQLVLKSRGLEITIEGCLSSPLPADNVGNLAQLLSTFLPAADPSDVASAIWQLSELVAADTQAYDVMGAAQRAVNSMVSALKSVKAGTHDDAGSRMDSFYKRLDSMDKEIQKQQGFLQKMAQTGGGGIAK
jgi:hypothetical protein